MNADATKRLKSAKGNHYAAVLTATRGLARAAAHAEWMRSRDMANFTTAEERDAADAAARNLATTVALLVLDAPMGTFTDIQVQTAKRTLR